MVKKVVSLQKGLEQVRAPHHHHMDQALPFLLFSEALYEEQIGRANPIQASYATKNQKNMQPFTTGGAPLYCDWRKNYFPH